MEGQGRKSILNCENGLWLILGAGVYFRIDGLLDRGLIYGDGILYWKGGNWKEELDGSHLKPANVWDVAKLLPEAGCEEKYILHFKG